VTRESIKSFVTYYIQSLTERTRREKSGTKWGIDWVVYSLGLAKFGKPVRLPFIRSGDSGFPKSKVEAEFGVDLAFLSDDGFELSIFVLKDEPLTNTTWTGNDFDRDLRMAMAPDLGAEGLEKVKTVTVILAYNKDDQQNGIEAYSRLVATAPRTLRDNIPLKFLRWNLSELAEQTIGHGLSASLLPERFFGQLSYLSAQTADFPHGSDAWQQQLVPNWKQFIDDVLAGSAGIRGALLIPVALIILRHHAYSNPSVETGWIDLVEWAAIALWRLHVRRPDTDIAVAVRRFWHDFYVAELKRFYRAHIDDLTTEQAVDHVGLGSFIGTVAAAYVAYWHIGRLGILATSVDESPEPQAARTQMLDEIANWTAMLVNASPAVFRPLLDIQHIEFFLLVEVFRRAGRADQVVDLLGLLVERLYLRRIGHSELPFLDGSNSLDNLFEQVATKPDQSLLLTDSSFFVLMLLELCCLLPIVSRDRMIRSIHRRLVLGSFDTGHPGDCRPLHLMSWFPPEDWATQVFAPDREGGQSVAAQPFAGDRDAPAAEILGGIRQLVSKMRQEAPPFRLPADIPLGAAILASVRYRKPLPPELWRRWAFPNQRSDVRDPDNASSGPDQER
jgi:hypothetical protein